MNPYSKRGADPEIQVLQIVSPSSNIRVGSNSLEPDAQGNSQHAANLSFSANRRRKRSPSASGSSNPNGLVGHTSGKLPAMLDLDKYKEVVKMAANDLHPQPSSSPPPPPSSSASKIYDSPWTKFSQGLSCCCFPFLLSACGMKGYYVQQAWREKVALCFIILCVMTFVAYFTIGMRSNLCPPDQVAGTPLFQADGTIPFRDDVSIVGYTFNFNDVKRILATVQPVAVNLTADWYGRDLSRLFDYSRGACSSFIANPANFCSVANPFPTSPNLTVSSCLSPNLLASLTPTSILTVDWTDLGKSSNYHVYDGRFMNLASFFSRDQNADFINVPSLVKLVPGTDSTLGLSFNARTAAFSQCLAARYAIGRLGSTTVGCSIYSALMITALVTVMGVILTRFLMALLFHWIIAPRMCSPTALSPGKHDVGYLSNPSNSRFFVQKDLPGDTGPLYKQGWKRSMALPTDLHTICLVTCYSEDEEAIRGTLDSIAGTDYPDDRKLIFVICDGLIHGAGNRHPTPDTVVSMIEQDDKAKPVPVSYLAIADGIKQHNMAQVYAGHYYYRQRPVPIIVVVKCGTEEERSAATKEELAKKKAGNRGKRDSQLILMHFLSRVNFDDRMTELDYDIFWKIQMITGGLTADYYQLLLMVDADTVVNSTSLRYMVQTMVNDPKVMGLCGETRISNKTQTWVTMIQVYEYFTSHNLGKAFESVFGGVTCLPGCFCMYRIKSTTTTQSSRGEFVPLLVNPDIVACYSENIVDTLHKKNLLLLGEDRFLSTLMLGSFPKRKMVYVPQAVCHTTVPHTYKILQSQRRRWINSTIHNLLELVFLPTLCGTFCLSMQFVIALELFGTVSLPIAVLLTFWLLISSAVSGANNILPLMLLLLVLFLPGILVLMTTKKPVYVLWMFVYLLALPIWNFFLPIYAFWHFDDFSWGDTRKIQGEKKQEDHSKRQGEYQIGSVRLKRWEEWELARRMDQSLPLPPVPTDNFSKSSNMQLSSATSLPKYMHETDYAMAASASIGQPKSSIAISAAGDDIIRSHNIRSLAPSVHGREWSVVANQSEGAVPVIQDLGANELATITTLLVPSSKKKSQSKQNAEPLDEYLHNSSDRPQTAFQIPPPVAPAAEEPSLAKQSVGFGGIAVAGRRASVSTLSTASSSSSLSPSVAAARRNSQPSTTSSILAASKIEKLNGATIETNLAVKPGNTINQFWKSMYMEQLEEDSSNKQQYVLSESFSRTKDAKSGVVSPSRQTPTLATTLASPKSSSDLVVASLSLSPSANMIHKSRPKNLEHSGLARHDTIDSIASYMTAPLYVEKYSNLKSVTTDETEDDFQSAASYASSTRSSLIQGSRPAPWAASITSPLSLVASPSLASAGSPNPESDSLILEDERAFQFHLEREAKTSTTTKAFQNFMRSASQSSAPTPSLSSSKIVNRSNTSTSFSSIAKQVQTYWNNPLESSAADSMASYQVSMAFSNFDISKDRLESLSKSKVLGARDFPNDLHDRTASASTANTNTTASTINNTYTGNTTSSRLKGSRPMPPK